MAGRDDEKASASSTFAAVKMRLFGQVRRSRMPADGQPPAFES